MKTCFLLAVIVSLAVTSGVFAQCPDAGPGSFGVYFLVDDQYVNSVVGMPPGVHDMYIILANPVYPSIGGWEMALVFDPASLEILDPGLQPPDQAMNFADLPEFIVGLYQPMDWQPCMVLAIMNVLVLTAEVVPISGCPTEPAGISGHPTYIPGEDFSVISPGYWSTDADGMYTDEDGCLTIPLAVFNGEAPVAVASATWTGLKSMYR
jgi:hypothetical protein